VNDWFIVCIYLLSASFIFGLILTRRIIFFAKRIRFVDKPGKRKIHDFDMPLLGGVSIYLTIILFLLFHLVLIIYATPVLAAVLSKEILEILSGVKQIINRLGLWIICSTSILILGLVDDKWNLNATIKLCMQSVVAMVIIISGFRITIFIENEWFSYLVSYIWIIGITNAFNFLDNMDGLASGVALISSIFLFSISISMNENFISGILAVFIGSLCSFLYYNFSPARIFMGDSGSMFIGFVIATITIKGTYYYINDPTIFSVAMPVFILAVPIYDVCSVILIRLMERRPVYKGDNSHFSHRLVQLGMSQKAAVLFIYLVTFLTGSSALLLNSVNVSGVILLMLQCLTILSIIALLEKYGRRMNSK